MSLSKYRIKRNFKNTPEPAGKTAKKSKRLLFVIQKHRATNLHYDFRLEMDGVLKSWAVPKGPSLNPADKRLAIMVEDHPLDYGKFTGIIPEGNYGAGDVEIWDNGYYTAEGNFAGPEEKALLKDLKAGHLKFNLHGNILNGEFALVRIKDAVRNNQWLLIKKDDEYAVHKKYDSNDIPPVKPLKRKSKPEKKTPGKNKTAGKRIARIIPGKNHIAADKLIKPMLAKVADKPVNGDDYAFEYKWDGYRCVTSIMHGEVNLYSRNGILFNKKYPAILDEFKQVKENIILDGELVALNKNNQPDFQMLQNNQVKPAKLRYYLFDLMYLNGETTTGLAYTERNELLNLFYKKYQFNSVVISEILSGNIDALSKSAEQKKLEGIIAKRKDGLYLPGKRSSDWLKIKIFNTQSAMICGFTKPLGSRSKFGSLILGIYKKNELTYIGHCGTGFNEKLLQSLYKKMSPLIVKKSPFKKIPETNQPATWLKPELICEVKFSEWTGDGVLRHPVFRGLRDDLDKHDVHEEPINQINMPEVKKIEKNNSRLSDREIKIGSIQVTVTNPDKIYWPAEQFTKGDLIKYYAAAAPYIFPYLKNRLLSLNRFPNGIGKPSFYQKDMNVDQLPAWVKTESVYSESADKNVDYILCKNEATILFMANLGCIELNPWNSRTGHLDYPDYLIIDLDPGDIGFNYVVKTALETKKLCDELNIPSYCKTSGASGLHIYIPLHAKYHYDQTRKFAEILACMIHERIPVFTSIERPVSKRKNKIYIDYLQNSRGQTIASVFSVRPRPGATVSTPLEWKEVNAKLDPAKFTIKNTLRSIASRNELFLPVLGDGVNLKKIISQIQPVNGT